MLRIIKVEEYDVMGFESETKYFKSLKKSKRYFKKLLKNHKNVLVSETECSYQGNPIEYSNQIEHDLFSEKATTGRHKSATLECWYSSQTDCGEEWDTTLITICLEEINIED